jgi:catechol 2,3-dioxygenase-like lactoylglutathione lyase family enzyme
VVVGFYNTTTGIMSEVDHATDERDGMDARSARAQRVVSTAPRLSGLGRDATIVLLQGDGGAAIAFHVGEPLATPDRVQFHLAVHDVDKEYERLRDEGVSFDERPTDRPWGVRSAAMRDPGGHSVELTTSLR